MLTATIDWALRHRRAVLAAWLVVAVAGLLSFRALPMDAFPDTTPTQVQVNTVAPALSPLEMERQVTAPLEQALASLPKVEELRSISKFGLSQITVQFPGGTDPWLARQLVAERVNRAELPEGIGKPVLGPPATGLGEIFHYLVEGEGKSLEELRTLHDWVVAPQLRSVPGVAEVNSWGGKERQWHVVVDPRKLQKFQLALGDVYRALEQNNANVGGGVLERSGGASLVLGVGTLTDGRAIEGVVIAAREGVPVRIRDVARVEVGEEIRRAAVTADGRGETVLGLGFLLTGENSRTVTEALAKRLAEIQKSLPEGVRLTPVYQRTELVELVLRTVRDNLFEAALLVIALLFLFLGNLRAGLVVAAAIPLSLLFAFSAMLRFGIAGTLMSLGAIDFGLVVDSSVILVENAQRRLGLEQGGRGVREVVREAALEVRKPTLFGELIIALVYLPVLTLEGVEGKLFRPMAFTVLFALLGSVLLSLTLAPVLASFALRRGARAEPRVVSWLGRLYAPALEWVLAHPRPVLASALALVVGTGALARSLGAEFLPRLSEGTIVINTVRLAEVSLGESVRVGSQLEKVLLEKFPGEVARVWTRTGTPEVATDPMGLEVSDLFVALKPRGEWKRARSQAELVEQMRRELEDLPGMRLSFTQPIEMRVNEMIAGVRSDLGIKLFGDDLDLLKAKAREIEAAIRTLPGAADVSVEQLTGQPVLEVTVDREAIARYGIPARQVLEVVEAVGVRKTGEIREGQRRFELGVRLAEAFRHPESLGEVRVEGPGGERIPLAKLARVREVSGPTTIQREWGKRRILVQANVQGGELGDFVQAARRAIDEQVELPSGYYLRFGGQFEHLERASARLLFVVPLALALVFFLLHLSNRNLADSLRVSSGVPFAMVGGVLALWLRGLPFSISAAVGFIALFGVAVLNGLVLVSRVRQLVEGGSALLEAVREAARSRLRPVLMTASVASLGFLPMALNTGAGAEVQRPLATVVIGGVLSSTLLTLLVLPVFFTLTRLSPLGGRGKLGGLLLTGVALLAGPAEGEERLTAEQAVKLVLERNPELSSLQAEVEAALARLEEAALLFPANPELGGGLGARSPRPEGQLEVELELSQELELPGQRGARLEVARTGHQGAQARLLARRVELASEARQAFARALAAEQLVRVAEESLELARQTARAAEKRLELGAGSRIELNTARVEAGRAVRELKLAGQSRAVALGRLKLLLAREPTLELGLRGGLQGALARPLPSTEALVDRANRQRAALAAAREGLEQAKAEQRFAERDWLPRPRLGARYQREQGEEVVLGLLSVDLPIFHRNQAGRGSASARVVQAERALEATERRIRQEVLLAASRLRAAQEAAQAFEGEVVQAMEESLRLAATAYQAGKLDLFQLLLLRRTTLEARRGYIETLEELSAAEAELAGAIGAEGGAL